MNTYKDEFNCSTKPPFERLGELKMYKDVHNLSFPINLARNIAKLNSLTYLTLPSDIELYPTKNFIQKFLKFVIENPRYIKNHPRNVFVLPVFEIKPGNEVSKKNYKILDLEHCIGPVVVTNISFLKYEYKCTKIYN